MKTQINAAPAVKGLTKLLSIPTNTKHLYKVGPSNISPVQIGEYVL